jgi:peptide/nickel transport system ATP-binding protein
MSAPLLSVSGLSVRIPARSGQVHAISGLDLAVERGEFLGIVGESGCGKTTFARALLRLLPPASITEGSIRLADKDLLSLPPAELRRVRGAQIGYIPQEPLGALDPTFAVGDQIAETIRAHRSVSRKAARLEATRLMASVEIPDAAQRYPDPPHSFSGGMLQRITIAIALANKPDLIIADEPTTALDVTVQRQVLSLLAQLARQSGTAVVLITHDLAVVSQVCDHVAVLYAGRLVEYGPAEDILGDPRHPYTNALLRSIPSAAVERGRLAVIPGEVPDLLSASTACPFAPRCPERMDRCEAMPPLAARSPRRAVACWLTAARPDGPPAAPCPASGHCETAGRPGR